MLVCNHVSFVDPLVILAASPRPIRFVMDHNIFKTPVRLVRLPHRQGDPDRAGQGGREAARTRRTTRSPKALAQGELVAIFPEGRITDTGELYPFRSGIERIVERTPVPVMPLALQGLVGQLLQPPGRPGDDEAVPARRSSRASRSRPRRAVAPAAATPEALQATVLAMRGDWR